MRLKDTGFYFITDRGLTKNGIVADVEQALEAGAKIIQYRDKDATTREMIQTGSRIKELTENHQAILIINDRMDICLAVDADGIHLGQEDMRIDIAKKYLWEKIIGITVHNALEATEAENAGADYLGVSPIFPTSTKNDAGNSIGTAVLGEIREKVSIPLIGIGGITLNNVEGVIRSGADGVCAISATVGKDVKKEVENFIRIIRKAKNDAI